jgi:hypothetical protein
MRSRAKQASTLPIRYPTSCGLVTTNAGFGAQEKPPRKPPPARWLERAQHPMWPHTSARWMPSPMIAADDLKATSSVSTFINSPGRRPFDDGDLHMTPALESQGLILIGPVSNSARNFDIVASVSKSNGKLRPPGLSTRKDRMRPSSSNDQLNEPASSEIKRGQRMSRAL